MRRLEDQLLHHLLRPRLRDRAAVSAVYISKETKQLSNSISTHMLFQEETELSVLLAAAGWEVVELQRVFVHHQRDACIAQYHDRHSVPKRCSIIPLVGLSLRIHHRYRAVA